MKRNAARNGTWGRALVSAGSGLESCAWQIGRGREVVGDVTTNPDAAWRVSAEREVAGDVVMQQLTPVRWELGGGYSSGGDLSDR